MAFACAIPLQAGQIMLSMICCSMTNRASRHALLLAISTRCRSPFPSHELSNQSIVAVRGPALCLLQVNYLGPYHLTRLLEPQLAASAPSRVVNVSSIMHRSGHVDADIWSFLTDWRKGSQYSNTKLANVLFTYEAQRRLGPKGIQVSCISKRTHC